MSFPFVDLADATGVMKLGRKGDLTGPMAAFIKLLPHPASQ